MRHFIKPKKFLSGDSVEITKQDHDTQSVENDSVDVNDDKPLGLTDQEWETAFNFFVF